MGLRGAANCGASVPKDALGQGREYVRRCAYQGRGGGFTYQARRGEPSPARTGTGIVSLEMLGEHGTAEALAGGDYLLKNPLTDANQGFYYYGIYYVSQAYNQLGGKYWEQGYPKLRDALLAAQSERGPWEQGSGQEAGSGRSLPHEHGGVGAVRAVSVFAAVSEVMTLVALRCAEIRSTKSETIAPKRKFSMTAVRSPVRPSSDFVCSVSCFDRIPAARTSMTRPLSPSVLLAS